jgi:hypothetical protein
MGLHGLLEEFLYFSYKYLYSVLMCFLALSKLKLIIIKVKFEKFVK